MIWSRLLLAFGVSSVAAALLAVPVAAQIGQSDAPVVISGREAVYLQAEGRVVYTGSVVVTQGDAKITTDKLTAFCARSTSMGEDGADSCEMERLVAQGNVYYIASDARIRGDRAEYDLPTEIITITGDVILSRGDDGVVRGTTVKYSVADGRTVITADHSRVTSIFNTTKRSPDTPPSSQAPVLAPTPN